ncbi:MAG: hypothetical protein WDN69_05775 [Aliidongia sp.]
MFSTVDSAVFMTENLDLIPLYGPVYMGLIRAVEEMFSDGRMQTVVLQIIQHGVSIAGIAVLATAWRGRGRVFFVATLATIGGCFDLFAHGVQADALTVGEAAALLGQFFRIVLRGPSWARLASYSLLLVVLAMTRYHFLVFGAVLPIYQALRLVLSPASGSERARDFAFASGATAAGLVITAWALWAICLSLGTHPTLYAGRQGTHRMAEAASLLPPERRAEWIEGIEARTDDPAVQVAIHTMCSGPVNWVTAWQALQLEPALWGQDVDDVENRAFHTFAFGLDDPVVRAQWLHEMSEVFPSDDGFWSVEIEEAAQAAQVVSQPASQAIYPWLIGTTRPDDAARWNRLSEYSAPWLIPLGQYFVLRVPLAFAVVLSIVGLVFRTGEHDRQCACLALIATFVLSVAGLPSATSYRLAISCLRQCSSIQRFVPFYPRGVPSAKAGRTSRDHRRGSEPTGRPGAVIAQGR